MAIEFRESMTLEELHAKLGELLAARPRPADKPVYVRVWLPGSLIYLTSAFVREGEVHLEGNLQPGSALE